MPVGLRAGWVPCVGFQPLKPSLVMVEDAENPIAEECERAFKRIRETHPQDAAAGGGAPAPSGPGMDAMDEDAIRPPARRPVSMPPLDEGNSKEKPAMKLLMSSKGVQDFHQVQEHYQNLMNQAPPSPEVNKVITEIASPSGKGAELFAKRKKRMDKFIVDETTVQKSQQTSITQQSSVSSSSTSSSFSSLSASSSLSSTSQNAKTNVTTANDKPKIATGLSIAPPAAAPGSFNLPDISKILTQPTRPTTKSEPSKPKPEPSKSKLVPATTPAGGGSGGGRATPNRPYQISAASNKMADNIPARSHASTPPSAATFASCPKPVAKTFSPLCFPPTGVSSSQRTTADSPIQSACSPKPLAKVFSPLCLSPSPLSWSVNTPTGSPIPTSHINRMAAVKSGNKSPKPFICTGNSASSSPVPTVIFKPKPLDLSKFHEKIASSQSTPALATTNKKFPGSGANVSVSNSSCAKAAVSFSADKSKVSAPVDSVTASPAATAPLKKQRPFPASSSSSSSVITPSTNNEISHKDESQDTLKPGSPPLIVTPNGTEMVVNGFEAKVNEALGKAETKTSTQQVEHKGIVNKNLEKGPTFLPATNYSSLNQKDLKGTSATQSNSSCSVSSTSTRASNIIQKDSCVKSITTTINNKPARPTSLPLISLSSLIHNVSQLQSPSPPSVPQTSVPPITPQFHNNKSAYDNLSSACNSLSQFSLASEPSFCKDASNGNSYHPISLAGESDSTNLVNKERIDLPPHKVAVISSLDTSASVSSEKLSNTLSSCTAISKTMTSAVSESLSTEQIKVIDSQVSHTSELTTVHQSSDTKTKIMHSAGDSTSRTVHPDSSGSIGSMSEDKEGTHKDVKMIKRIPQLKSLGEFKGYDFVESPLPIPKIQVYDNRKRSSLNEDELRDFLSDWEKSFENSSLIDTINVTDLHPPDFYRSVSRASYNEEVEGSEQLFVNDLDTESDDVSSQEKDSCAAEDIYSDKEMDSSKCNQSQANNEHSPSSHKHSEKPVPQQTEKVLEKVEKKDAEAVEVGKVEEKVEQGVEVVVDGKQALTELTSTRQGTEMSLMSAKTPPPMTSSLLSCGTNNRPDPSSSAGAGAIYTAEVKVVQRASLPPTPVDVPHHSLLDLVNTTDQMDKRRSASFNLAAKGWGTYNNFYTPVTFATHS